MFDYVIRFFYRRGCDFWFNSTCFTADMRFDKKEKYQEGGLQIVKISKGQKNLFT